MPELPELEVVCEVLRRRVLGQRIVGVEVRPPGGPLVVRDLLQAGVERSLFSAAIGGVSRRGRFVIFVLAESAAGSTFYLVVNPKLTGRLQLAEADDRRLPKTHVVLTLSAGGQLRYVDHKTMGQLYLTDALDRVPGLAGMGPEALGVSLDEFRERLRSYRGEIKGILTRSEFVVGIGNAYADEILWSARLYPYRKRTQLAPTDVDQLYEAMRSTLLGAIDTVRAAMGEAIHLKPREFMAVHMKSGEPCPRCGTPISLVGANQRVTNFCRTCQPGGLIRGM